MKARKARLIFEAEYTEALEFDRAVRKAGDKKADIFRSAMRRYMKELAKEEAPTGKMFCAKTRAR